MADDRFVLLPFAAERTGLSESELTAMAAAGGIKIVWVTTTTVEQGQMAVRLEDVERLQITRGKYTDMYRDRFVGLSDAARLLKIPKTTLAHWINDGVLKTISREEALETVKQRPGGEFYGPLYEETQKGENPVVDAKSALADQGADKVEDEPLGADVIRKMILPGEDFLLKDKRRSYALRLADVAYAVAIHNFRQEEADGKTSRLFDEKGDMYRPRWPSKWRREKKNGEQNPLQSDTDAPDPSGEK